jgi:hypothetical protein
MTPARKYALRWFAEHEQDPTSVLLKRAPSTKMHRLMARQMQLDPWTWRLTPEGRAALAQCQQRPHNPRQVKQRPRRAVRLKSLPKALRLRIADEADQVTDRNAATTRR